MQEPQSPSACELCRNILYLHNVHRHTELVVSWRFLSGGMIAGFEGGCSRRAQPLCQPSEKSHCDYKGRLGISRQRPAAWLRMEDRGWKGVDAVVRIAVSTSELLTRRRWYSASNKLSRDGKKADNKSLGASAQTWGKDEMQQRRSKRHTI